MSKEVTGTEDQKSSPSESKFEKATELMKESFSIKSDKDDLSEKESTHQEGEKEEAKDEPKEGSKEWQERYKHVQSYADKMSAKAEQLAYTLVSKDPDAIHEIAKADAQLADKIVAKELSKEFGIKTYVELVEALKSQEKQDDAKPAKTTELEERLKTLETEKEQAELEKAEQFLEDFKSKNPDFSGEIEEKTWKLFDSSSLTLEQAYKYTMFELGKTVKESEIEEKVYRDLASKKAASAVSSSSVKGSNKTSKTVTPQSKNFLEAIGATKTLNKYS